MTDNDDLKPQTDPDGESGFLSRWARRKSEARNSSQAKGKAAEKSREENPVDGEVSASTEAGEEERQRAEEEARNREAAEAVDMETLDYESDYSVFFKAGVPSALKNQALRRLWRSNPVLANLDGLNDYDEDFTIGAAGDTVKSLWKVGRGFLDDPEEADLTEAVSEPVAENETENGIEDETGADGNHSVVKESPVDAGAEESEPEEGRGHDTDVEREPIKAPDEGGRAGAGRAGSGRAALRRRIDFQAFINPDAGDEG